MTALTPTALRDLTGIDLSDEQIDAATAPLEPSVIVAGAGTGKTTLMAARVVWLVACELIEPERVLGLTFTTKATAQLLARVRRSLASVDVTEGADPTILTYHSFASRVVDEFGLRAGIDAGVSVMSGAERYRLAHQVVCELPAPPRSTSTISTIVEQVLALDDACAEHSLDPVTVRDHDSALLAELASHEKPQRIAQQMRVTAEAREELADLVIRFRHRKLELGRMDFADQLRWAERIAITVPEAAAALRERHGVVLLDEYQDTSVTQRRLMQALFGDGHPVTAVGDPCQAIYGWRGASVDNIDRFPEHFPAADGRPAARYPLTVNRRSGPWILEAANLVATPLRQEHAGVHPLASGGTEHGPGHLRCGMFASYDEEIDWVADRIKELGAAYDWSSMAVLARAGTGLPALQSALAARGIPADIVGTTALLDLPEVVEVRSILEVLHDPTANAALLRILSGPRWRIGPADLALLAAQASRISRRERPAAESALDTVRQSIRGVDPADVPALSDALLELPRGISDEAARRMSRLAAEIASLRGHAGEPIADLIHRVLAVTGLDVELAASPEAVAARRRESVAALITVASDIADAGIGSDLGAFLAYLRDCERWEESPGIARPGDGNAVSLMTVHRSKGLEFPVVVLPFLSAGVFPAAQGRPLWPTSPKALPFGLGDEPVPPGLEFPLGVPRAKDHDAFTAEAGRLALLEETRLAYVGITRAEQVLVASGHWWGPSQKKPRPPSSYLEAIRAACEAGGGRVDGWAPPPDAQDVNPLVAAMHDRAAWPVIPDAAARRSRLDAAAAVRSAMANPGHAAVAAGSLPESVTAEDRALIAAWDRDWELLIAEASLRQDRSEPAAPESLTAAQVMAAVRDIDQFRRRLRRPMPRPPAIAARRGTSFHAWVEARFGQLALIDADDLPGSADDAIESDADLELLRESFLRTGYATRKPMAVEEPFAVVLGGRVVRGRIDAVFVDGDVHEVVDWKTSRGGEADPLQLAIYRLAWAERMGIDPESVLASFVMVRTGEVIRPRDLPVRDALEALVAGL